MKVIKNINNNVSLCVDSKGREVIAFGKGIGFIKPPYDVPLSKIERTFYNIQDLNFDGIKAIPASILVASIKIVDKVEMKLNVKLMSTAALSLADHINFAIQRMTDSIALDMPIQENIKQLYPDEIEAAYNALSIIKEETGVQLGDKEASSIALHFITSKIEGRNDQQEANRMIVEKSLEIIEETMSISVDRSSFNYSRFVTHVDYLIRRVFKEAQIDTKNVTIFETMKNQYPETYVCTLKISDLFKDKINIELSDEEKLYLILHINRLCSREVESHEEI